MIIRTGVYISRYLQLTTSDKISKRQRRKETIVKSVIKTFAFFHGATSSSAQHPLVRNIL